MEDRLGVRYLFLNVLHIVLAKTPEAVYETISNQPLLTLMHPRRILLVDDSIIFRAALAELIQCSENWVVCGEAATGTEAISKTKELTPDVVLIDLSMPHQNGLEVARKLQEESPALKIFIMSEQDPGTLSIFSSKSGFECLPKSRMVSDLIPALDRSFPK